MVPLVLPKPPLTGWGYCAEGGEWLGLSTPSGHPTMPKVTMEAQG